MKIKTTEIALVGQIFPFRGGIAQYNTQLKRSLSDISTLKTVSFEKIYPNFLYPGKSVFEENSEGKSELDVEYVINVYKPWTLFQSAKLINESGVKVALLTWWTIFWQPGLALVAWLIKRKGAKVVYICHNVYDHDANIIKQYISKYLLKRADGYIVHSAPDAKKIESLTSKPILNTKVLPIYKHYPKTKTYIKKRGRLELLFFGFIRPYKGLDDLVQALAILNDAEVYLTIAGEPWIDPVELKKKIETIGAPNIEMHFSYVNDVEASFYFSRADVVVVPYRAAAASAVASLAFNYEKPVLGSKVDGIKDIIKDGETGWLVEPNSPELLKEKIKEISRDDASKMNLSIRKFCDEHSWSALAKQISDFTDSL